jgi:hypothetical protein
MSAAIRVAQRRCRVTDMGAIRAPESGRPCHGDAASAQARVTWPDGARSGWLPLRLGGVTVLARDGSGGTEAATVGAASP